MALTQTIAECKLKKEEGTVETMRSKCEYCGNYMESTDQNCPNCGAVNPNHQRSANGVPRTIDELKAFCKARDLPLEKMRFFIGEDYREPRAFGIYQDDDGNFVVYKNKADGSRAIRYQGTDEAYAVNELYQKMRSEVQNQKSHAAAKGKAAALKQKHNGRICMIIFLAVVIAFVALYLYADETVPDKGYYGYDSGYYYFDSQNWYGYDDALGAWGYVDMEESPLDEHYRDYLIGSSYDADAEYSDFADSEYGQESSQSDSDWDDSDWDDDDWSSVDDWDSSYTDWDSDW